MDSETKGILLIGGIIALAIFIGIYISIEGSGQNGMGLFKFWGTKLTELLRARISLYPGLKRLVASL